MKENAILLRRPSVQALFNGYYFDDSLAAMNGTTSGRIDTKDKDLDLGWPIKKPVNIKSSFSSLWPSTAS